MINTPYQPLLDSLAEDYMYLTGDIVLRTDPSKKLPLIEFLPTYSNASTPELPKTCIKWHNVFIPVEIVALYLDPRKVVVPEKHMVIYKDGDHMNYDPSNLYVVSRVAKQLLKSMGHTYAPKFTKALGYQAVFSSDNVTYDLGYFTTLDMANISILYAKTALYIAEIARLSKIYGYTTNDHKNIEAILLRGYNNEQ